MDLTRTQRVVLAVMIVVLIPVGFWLDVLCLRFYVWMGWL